MYLLVSFVEISLIKSLTQSVFFLSVAKIYAFFLLVLLCVSWSAKNKVLLYTGFPLWLLMGVTQYVLAQGLHEAWHFHFKGKAKKISRFLISYPLGIPQSAKDIHFAHHRFFGDPQKDPDYSTYGTIPKSKAEFQVFVAKSFFGISAVARFLQLTKASDKAVERDKKTSDLFLIVAAQLIILLVFFLLGIWQLYLLYWILPLITLVKTVTNFRLIAEHGEQDGSVGLRSFLSKSKFSKWIGAYGFSEHAEHHLVPSIEYRDLPVITKVITSSTLTTKGSGTLRVEYVEGNHFQYLAKIYFSLS